MIKILNEANEATILMTGDIGQSWFSDGWTLDKFKDVVSNMNVTALTIEVKSNGGDVMEAFAIYDKIKSMPARVTVKIIGSSASAATIIASGADRILISENSRYLVHNAQTFIEGNKEMMKDAYKQLESFDNQILDIYVKRTGKSRDLLAQLMTEERWMTANEALEWGFVDDIIKPENKITNMKKFQNLTEEEQMEMDQLIADKAALTDKVAELEAKLAEYETAQAEKMEEELEEEVTAAIRNGKIKAEQKASWVEFGRVNITAMKAAVSAIVTTSAGVANVPAPATGNEHAKTMTWDQVVKNWKNNVYKNNTAQYVKDFTAAKGYAPKI